MYTSFPLKKDRLPELQKFIRKENLKSVRFAENPLLIGESYQICLNMDVEDNNKLNILHNKWYEEDNPQPKEKTFWEKVKYFFNFFKKQKNYEYSRIN